MAGINIDFVADVGKFLGGAKQIESELDKVASSLDNLADDAKRAGREAERGLAEIKATEARDNLRRLADEARDSGSGMEAYFSAAADAIDAELQGLASGAEGRLDGIGDEGKSSAEKLERSFKESLEAVSDKAKSTGDDVDRSMREGGDRASGAVSEFKDEATSNFSEVASSFSGDMDSAADLVQGTLGGLAGSIPGGVGLALGGLGALAGLFYSQWSENAEKTEARIQSMYEDMAESGSDYLSENYVRTEMAAIIENADRYAQVMDLASRAGVGEDSALRALAGDAEAAAPILDTLNEAMADNAEKRSEIYSQYDQGQRITGDNRRTLDALLGEQIALQGLAGELGNVTESTEVAASRADVYGEALRSSQDTTRAAIDAQNALEDAVTSAGEAIDGTAAVTRDEEDALLNLADAAKDNSAAMRDNGDSADAVTVAQNAAAAKFLETASAMGMADADALTLAQSLGLIPSDVTTVAAFESQAASDAAAAQKEKLDTWPATVKTTLLLDDSALRNYRIPVFDIPTRLARPGVPTWI